MSAHHKDRTRYLPESVPAHERRMERMRDHAEAILEGPLRRQRWTPGTRDSLAQALDKIVVAEIKRAFPNDAGGVA